MQQITPCLWFDSEAEEAAQFYCSVFESSRVRRITRYGKEVKEGHGRPAGSVLTVECELNGQTFTAFSGRPVFKFNEAISFQVPCETQTDVDDCWERLSAGGEEKAQQCGWLKDKYGVSWQTVPAVLAKMLQDKDRARADRVMAAMLGMKKINIADLERAYAPEKESSR